MAPRSAKSWSLPCARAGLIGLVSAAVLLPGGPVPAAVPAFGAVEVGVATASVSSGLRRIATSEELATALSVARPGEVLQLIDGTYEGRFVADVSGTASAPIVLRGGRGAILDGGPTSEIGYALHLLGADHWRLEGFSVQGGQKGIVLDRSNQNVLTGLDIGSTGMEGVHLRAASSDNRIEYSSVHDTGLDEAGFGEGVYLGSARSNWSKFGADGTGDRSDRNHVVGNRIYATTAENIDVKEGTTGGVISGNFLDGSAMTGANSADSWIDVKGSGYRIVENTGVDALTNGFETHVVVEGWGRDNVFAANTLKVNSVGFGVKVDKPRDSANVVACDNHVTGAKSGRSNVTCT